MHQVSPAVLVLGAVLLVTAAALVLYNLKQAITGFRQMGRLDRQFQQVQESFDQRQSRLDDFYALKRQFDEVATARKLSAEDRSRLWKPVDEAVARSVEALLANNGPQADIEMVSAMRQGREILSQCMTA